MDLLNNIDNDVSNTGQVSQTTIEQAREMLDQSMIITPSIGAEFKGGRYAGMVHDVTKDVSYHLIYAESFYELFNVTQHEATKSISSEAINGYADWHLPTSQDAMMLKINASDSFDLDERYWTSTEGAAAINCAYTQSFESGKQFCINKCAKFRARAVRYEPKLSKR